MRLTCPLIFVAFLVAISTPALGQSGVSTTLGDRIEERGYTHVSIGFADRVIGFQNRRYRDEGRAVHEIIREFGEEIETLALVGRARGIDIYSVRQNDARLDVRPARPGMAGHQPMLLDFVIHPFFGAQLGSYSQPVRARTGIAPEIALYPWRGGKISAQIELVAVDDVSLNPKRIAPGLVTASHWLRIPLGHAYASAGAGLFSHERYGLSANVQSLFAGGRIAIHGHAAYTGLAALESRTWYVSSLNRVQALGGVEYVHSELAASVLIRAGRFLDGDDGIRVDVRRAFGGFQVGFFGVSTTIDNTAGVSVRIPLLPGRHSAARMRIVPGRQLPIEYRYSAAGGRIMRTGYEIDLFGNQLHPAVVEMQLRRAAER